MRNEVKRKAKVVIDSAYGLAAMTGPRKVSAAQWLVKTHPLKTKSGVRQVPNFLFGEISFVWRKDKINTKVSKILTSTPSFA